MEPSVEGQGPFGIPVRGASNGTRDRILASALEVFGDVSYGEARVGQIADGAGCSRPALYQYFSSKDDVFWALASELRACMKDHARALGPVSPERGGIDHLRGWIRDFMALHEAWAPVFNGFAAARRGSAANDASAANGRSPAPSSLSRSLGTPMATSLLDAFGLPRTPAARRTARMLVLVLIRCSFYAEAAPSGLDREPMVKALALLVHRTLVGPIEGVNVVRRRSRHRVAVVAPVVVEPMEPLLPRAERTRTALLGAGAAVLPSRGYHGMRVDDIVERAGVAHGTFYRYFDSMDDFFEALAMTATASLMDLLARLRLDGAADELREWLHEWFGAYAADGGVISTWQDMRTSPELRDFSQGVAVTCFARLEALLSARDFSHPQVDAALLLALLERGPYGVHVLGSMSRRQGVETTCTIIRRGFLGLDPEREVAT